MRGGSRHTPGSDQQAAQENPVTTEPFRRHKNERAPCGARSFFGGRSRRERRTANA